MQLNEIPSNGWINHKRGRPYMRYFFLIGALSFILSAPCYAGLKTTGHGDAMSLDPTDFPADMKTRYEIMKAKCVKCHSMERTIIALKTGIAPFSGQLFDRSAAKMNVKKMMRKPDSNMSKEETQAVVELLNYLLDDAAR
jgi:L-fucose mutarotase/ribose pyranase (RbsD/FucU family)